MFVSNLKDQKPAEEAGMKTFGMECIEQCRSAASPAQYRENLAHIADLFAEGVIFHLHGFLTEDNIIKRRRLPTRF